MCAGSSFNQTMYYEKFSSKQEQEVCKQQQTVSGNINF